MQAKKRPRSKAASEFAMICLVGLVGILFCAVVVKLAFQ